MAMGSEWLARAIASTGTTHVFFMDAVLRRTLDRARELRASSVFWGTRRRPWPTWPTATRASPGGRPSVSRSRWARRIWPQALQDAYLARSPVVALTGRKPPALQHRNAYQEIAHAPLFAAGDEVPCRGRYRRKSAAAAAAGDPGGGIGNAAPGSSRPQWRAGRDRRDRAPSRSPRRSGKQLWRCRRIGRRRQAAISNRPAAALRGAARVAIVAGEGALASAAGPEILALAEALAAPVATSLGARGLVPTRHSFPPA